jgi:hypothetical protein
VNTPSASKPSVPKEVQKTIAVHEEEIKKLKTQCGIMREKARKNQPKSATADGSCLDGKHCQRRRIVRTAG